MRGIYTMEKAPSIPETTDPSNHAPWLEMSQTHSHEGEDIQLQVKWGPHAPADEETTAFVVHPTGELTQIVLEGQSPITALHFKPPVEGIYHIIISRPGKRHQTDPRRENPDSNEATCCTHYAQYIVAVGHHPDGNPKSSGIPLEIRPHHWHHWRAGDVLALAVFHQGTALINTPVDVIVDGPDGCRQWREITDRDGTLALRTGEPGRYRVVAHHQVPAGDGQTCDKLSLSTNLAFMVTK